MYPHERSLVEKFKDKPFAIVGVNSDKDRATAQRAVKENGLTWRNFWAGPAGTAGPIPATWNVGAWPTLYVIDHDGVIRHVSNEGGALDAALEKWIAEAAKARTPQGK